MNVGNMLTVKTSSSPSSPSFWSAVEEVVEPTEKETGAAFNSSIQHSTDRCYGDTGTSGCPMCRHSDRINPLSWIHSLLFLPLTVLVTSWIETFVKQISELQYLILLMHCLSASVISWTATLQHSVPSARSSMAFRTPLSNALASAGLWKDRPHFLSSTFQWWNVGVAMVYTRSFLSGQSRITCSSSTYQPCFLSHP